MNTQQFNYPSDPRKFDQYVEKYYINLYVDHLNKDTKQVELVECPIKSINHQLIPQGQGIPDAIIKRVNDDDRYFLEETRFFRNQKEAKFIGECTKHWKRKFGDSPYAVPPAPEFTNPNQEYANAVEKKIIKDYSSFTQMSGLPQKGTLLIIFDYIDPFTTIDTIAFWVDVAQKHSIANRPALEASPFNKIILGARLRNNTADNAQCLFETIWKYE